MPATRQEIHAKITKALEAERQSALQTALTLENIITLLKSKNFLDIDFDVGVHLLGDQACNTHSSSLGLEHTLGIWEAAYEIWSTDE